MRSVWDWSGSLFQISPDPRINAEDALVYKGRGLGRPIAAQSKRTTAFTLMRGIDSHSADKREPFLRRVLYGRDDVIRFMAARGLALGGGSYAGDASPEAGQYSSSLGQS
jgi:hypothetical protein